MQRTNLPPPGELRPASPSRPINDDDHNAGGFPPSLSGNGRRAVWPRVARLDGVIPETSGTEQAAGPLSRGRQHTSGARRADGGNVGPAGGAMRHRGPRFDTAVARNGYAWWYIDALSDDGAHGLTIIAFVGSVFSPYYAASRRRGNGNPLDHCAVNVALYGPRGKYWALTERREPSLSQTASTLAIGQSALNWDGDRLSIDIDELAVPRFVRLKGRITLHPQAVTSCATQLDSGGRHHWWPIAPVARVEVDMQKPALRWNGSGYFDCNAGTRPLEKDFGDWTWSRSALPDGAAILYEARRRDGSNLSLAYRFDHAGHCQEFLPPLPAQLPSTGWRIARVTRSDDVKQTGIVKTLEDTPFYARSLVSSRLLGAPVISVHESLSLDRFDSRWVQTLLPFRMPRAFR